MKCPSCMQDLRRSSLRQALKCDGCHQEAPHVRLVAGCNPCDLDYCGDCYAKLCAGRRLTRSGGPSSPAAAGPSTPVRRHVAFADDDDSEDDTPLLNRQPRAAGAADDSTAGDISDSDEDRPLRSRCSSGRSSDEELTGDNRAKKKKSGSDLL